MPPLNLSSMIRKNIKEKMNYKAEILKSDYKKACDAYLHRFCELIEMDEYYADWVDVGGIAEIGDYYVSMQDMITAVENNITYNKFIEWYDYTLRCNAVNLTHCNLYNWLHNCPVYTDEQIERLEKACKAMIDAKAEYKKVSAEVREEFERGRK